MGVMRAEAEPTVCFVPCSCANFLLTEEAAKGIARILRAISDGSERGNSRRSEQRGNG